MRLLVFTQKVDQNDGVLGFFHGWLKKFSEQFENIRVICLLEGIHNLPENVSVFSLGKENFSSFGVWNTLKSKGLYIARFFRFLFQERKNYDAVFVHMNPVYVVLGSLFWKFQKRPVYIWYNHHQADIFGKIAFRLATKIFHTSPFAYSARYPQAQKMPAGVDTDTFYRTGEKKPSNSILFVGRISPIKSVETLIEAVQILTQEGIDCTLSLVGKPDPEAQEYYKSLQEQSKELQKQKKIYFLGAIPNKDMATIYNTHEVLINLSPSGLYDKTIPEAMACESLVLASSPAFTDLIGPEFLFEEKNAKSLAQHLQRCFAFSDEKKKQQGKIFRQQVEKLESLELLTQRITQEIDS